MSAGTATWWQVAFNDNLTGWAYQGGLALASPTAPTLSFSANPREHRPRRLVDAVMVVDQRDFLQRNRLLSIGRLRISLSLADCKHHVQHHLHRQRRIYGSISGGDREAGAQLHLESVAPGHFQQSGDRSLRRHGDARPGLHGRKPVCGDRRLDGSSARKSSDHRRPSPAARFSDRQLGRGSKFHSRRRPTRTETRTIRRSPLWVRRISITT